MSKGADSWQRRLKSMWRRKVAVIVIKQDGCEDEWLDFNHKTIRAAIKRAGTLKAAILMGLDLVAEPPKEPQVEYIFVDKVIYVPRPSIWRRFVEWLSGLIRSSHQ